MKRRIREILWHSFDRTPEERWFIHKTDFFLLAWASLSCFGKNLNTSNVSKSRRKISALQRVTLAGRSQMTPLYIREALTSIDRMKDR